MDKKPSLKQYLLNEIMREGYITLEKAYGIAASLNHKQKTVERRLNPSESPMIETCYNEKGHIIGYKVKINHNTALLIQDGKQNLLI